MAGYCLSKSLLQMVVALVVSLVITEFNSLHAAERPNVLIILVDDMGFSDLGCYGSEIETPSLDKLSSNGARFTNFYNTARCWPTRAALMTGFYAQQVHRDGFTKSDKGNQGERPSWARMLPDLLKPAGYRSYHSGKWHLDGEPMENGFDHSYQLLDDNRHFAPNRHRLDGQDLPKVGLEDGYFATHAITDRMLSFLSEHQSTHPQQPFFGYVAYIAPHFPLHAPAKTIDKYKTKYQAGWDKIRQARLERQTRLGLQISTNAANLEPEIGPPYAFPKAIEQLGAGEVNRELPWDSLTDQQKSFQANKMAIHAAMVDDIDQQVGRIASWLEANDQLNDTLLIFLSDNGASAEIMVRGDGHDPAASPGSPLSYLCLGPGWSRCANTPFRRHKTWVHEGGISTSMVVHWPKGIASNGIREQIGHVCCIAPTIMEAAGLPIQPSNERGPKTFSGISLLPAIQTNSASNSMDSVWFLHEDNKALRQGDWKIVKAANEDWQLYNLKTDRIEANDLAKSQPERLASMIAQWEELTESFRQQANTSASEKSK